MNRLTFTRPGTGRATLFTIGIIFLAFFLTAISAGEAGASGADGPGGGGAGCPSNAGRGYHCPPRGAGWREYGINSSGPRDFSNGTKWSDVQRQCRDLGANIVTVYVIGNNASPKQWRGYTFGDPSVGTRNDQSGGSWISNETARARFNARLGGSGSKWAQNVGWFCYNSNPTWDIVPTSYVSKTNAKDGYGGRAAAGRTITAKPGQDVWFKHIIDKDGSGTAVYDRWREHRRNTSGYSFNSNYPIEKTTLAVRSVTYPGKDSDKRYRIPASAPHNALYCERYKVSPRSNSSGSSRTSASVCVRVVRPVWSITPTISISQTTASPGNKVTWTHNIRNNGKDSTDATVSYEAINTGNLGSGRAGGAWTRGSGLGSSSTATSRTTSVTVTQGHVGESLCRTTRANPRSHSNSSSVTSSQACVSVPFNYSLTPRAPDVPDSGEAGSTIPSVAGGRVTNSGPTKSRDNTIWQLTSFVLRSGITPSGPTNNGTAPCRDGSSNNRYNGNFFGAATCKSLDRGSGSVSTGTPRNLNASDITIPDNLEVGDRFCFAVSVRDRTHNPGNTPWSHSAPTCIIISKKPKVNVLGGDLWVRANRVSDSSVSTSITSNSEGVFGSFVEYALAVRGDVSGMASAAGYHGSSSVRLLCGVSFLTLGNNGANNTGCSDQQVGRYGRLPSTSPRLENRFSTDSSNRLTSGSNLSNKNGTYTAQGATLSINQSTIDRGDSVILVAPSTDVIISGNIEYDDGEMSSIGDIPQVIIIARNIYINQGVENVDAWLVANGDNLEHGYINTCRVGGTTQQSKDMARGLNSETCDRPLTVNGPVMANHLLMRRTAGAGAMNRAGEPAEVFNLRPDAYLWMANRINSGVGLPTTSTRELPPKY